MLTISGELMSRDWVIAKVENGIITNSDPALLPLFLKRTGDVESWLASRAIDAHRVNARLLKKALRLTGIDDAELVLKVNAATITDTYWFREYGSSLCYENVRFKKNMFDKLALRGDPDSFNQPYSPNPELTNTGSFEKCWRLSDGKWWMIKQGNELELFSELFICKLGKALGFPMAQYTLDSGYIKSPDFTDGASVNYEPAAGIVGDNEDYTDNFEAFWKLSPDLAMQYLQIIYMDTLCFNMDRHTQNYGILRDVETGAILSMAPNFDNNVALFARGYPQNSIWLSRKNDKLISLFCELLEKDDRALSMAKTLPVPTWEMTERCVLENEIPADAGDVCDFIMFGCERIQSFIRDLSQESGMEWI